jgi:hypothetical protein
MTKIKPASANEIKLSAMTIARPTNGNGTFDMRIFRAKKVSQECGGVQRQCITKKNYITLIHLCWFAKNFKQSVVFALSVYYLSVLCEKLYFIILIDKRYPNNQYSRVIGI